MFKYHKLHDITSLFQLFRSGKVYEFYQFSDTYKDRLTDFDDNDIVYFEFMTLDNREKVISRTVMGIMDVFGTVGGAASFFTVLFTSIFKKYSRISFRENQI